MMHGQPNIKTRVLRMGVRWGA